MIIQPVNIEHIHQTWPLVEKYLQESLNKGLVGGTLDYNIHHVQSYLVSDQWVLLVAVEDGQIHGAMTLSFLNYPLNRVAFVTATGGKMIINKDTFEQLKHIAKHYGATKIQAMARPAMVRLLQACDMKPGNTLMEYKL